MSDKKGPMFFHFRITQPDGISPKGGATVVADTETGLMSIALCCTKDRYEKKMGRELAMTRLSLAEFLNARGEVRKTRRRFPSQRMMINRIPPFGDDTRYAKIKEEALLYAIDCAGAVGNGEVFDACDQLEKNRKA